MRDNIQDRARLAGGVLLIATISAAIGYIIASGIVQWWIGLRSLDLTYIALNWEQIAAIPRLHSIALLCIGGGFFAGLGLGARVVSERLTTFGTTHWMTPSELKRKNFHADSRVGFVLGKQGKPKDKSAPYIVSGKHPHCLVVAPTGRGKGVGFVIPNLLSYKGSAVVLDVKGENYEATSRFRQSMGQTIYRFGPRDFDQPSHRYNPLARVSSYTNPAKRMAELEKIAALFLQADDTSAASFLPNSREIFVACSILAYEQGKLNLGHVYRLAFGGVAPNLKFLKYADQVQDRSAKLLFQKLGNTTEKTLSAYLSVLSSAGMAPWSNPHTGAVTARSDFDFSTFRKVPQTVYFTVPADDVTAIAPLVRLFFSDLIATLQHHEPGPDEPFPVLILLDEFQRIGRMQIIIDSISLLRSYRGNLAIVTQTIPNLDEVYGETSRKALQGGAGIKLYLTPSEEDTVQELSASVGMTTKRVVSKSRTIGAGGVFGTNVSERTEDHPLLPPDQARRLPADKVVIVVDADLPIMADRIQYYDDYGYRELYESQDFTAPLPAPSSAITEADYEYIETIADQKQTRADIQVGIEADFEAAKGKVAPPEPSADAEKRQENVNQSSSVVTARRRRPPSPPMLDANGTQFEMGAVMRVTNSVAALKQHLQSTA